MNYEALNKLVFYAQKYSKTFYITWVPLFLLFFMSNFGLDYVLTNKNGETFTLPNGQYIFFFTTLFAVFIILKNKNISISILKNFSSFFYFYVFLFVASCLFANQELWNWKIVLLVLLLSSCAAFSASNYFNQNSRKQILSIFVIALPFFLPVLFGTILQITGPLYFFTTLENSQHLHYDPARWFFLNSSANGLGIDAAISALLFFVLYSYTSNKLGRVCLVILFFLSLYVLFKTGTRAAMVFFLFGFLAVVFSTVPIKKILVHFSFFVFAFSIYLALFGVDYLQSYFRLNGGLAIASSTRWDGINQLSNLIWDSPFFGIGFGEADRNLKVDPSNLFYFAIPVELGIMGLFGALGIMLFPLVNFFSLTKKHKQFLLCSISTPIICMAYSVIIGFFPYLLFEFNVLRISPFNQLYFFCWGVLLFHICSFKQNISIREI